MDSALVCRAERILQAATLTQVADADVLRPMDSRLEEEEGTEEIVRPEVSDNDTQNAAFPRDGERKPIGPHFYKSAPGCRRNDTRGPCSLWEEFRKDRGAIRDRRS